MVNFYNSQMVTVRGIVKDSSGTNGIAISVNDTVRKFRDKAFKDSIFKEKYWNRHDKLIHNKNLFTYPDSVGNYTITTKLTDTLYFYKRKYTTQKYKVEDILKNNIEVNLKLAPCIADKKWDYNTPSKLYIFIGKKINVSSVDTSKYCGETMDSEYSAQYKIEQEFADHYPNSEIIFSAYDHNSRYEYMFQNYDNVLIFIGEYCGDLIQLKYQFFPVYKTKDGKWASPVDTYMESYYKSDQFIPTNITFDKSVVFDLLRTNKTPSEEQIAQLKKFKYPEKYYKIVNGKAIPIMGRYAEDLVKLWNELYWKNKN
jgi:hypothetical protein